MRIISTIVLSLFSVLFYSQKITLESDMQVVYSLKFKPDSTQEKLTDNLVTLYINNNHKSIFQDDKKGKIDSIIAGQKFTQLSSLPMFKTNHVIYKDLNKGEMTYSEIVDKINFGYNEKINDIKWKLINEKKTILSYECHKAVTKLHGRDYIAWYTKDIPYSDGPYKFSGLPGLILKVNDDGNNFQYDAISIIKKKVNIIYNTDFNKTDRIRLRDSKINNILRLRPDVKLNPMEKN